MHSQRFRDDELLTREANAIVWNEGSTERRIRCSHVHHNPGLWALEMLDVRLLYDEWQFPFVDFADFPLGAGNSDKLPGFDIPRCILTTNNGGNAELPGDNCGMGGASSFIRHNRGGNLHDWFPIGIGDIGDEDFPFLELGDVLHALNHPCLPGAYFGTDRVSLGENFARALHLVFEEHIALILRVHRFRPRLHDVELPTLPILRPLHIHRLLIVILDDACPPREIQDFLIRDGELFTIGELYRFLLHRTRALRGIHELLLFRAKFLFNDRFEPSFECRLMNIEFIRIRDSLHDVFPQTVDRIDEHRILKPALGIDREHHSRGAHI